MSKKPYDFLASDKEPLLYFDKTKIVMKDGSLSALNKNGVILIPPSSVLILMLGYGTSITNDAAIFCAENDMQIAFVKGEINIHSFFMCGRYKNPQSIINQISLQNKYKLEVAKKFLLMRLDKIKSHNLDHLNFVSDCKSIENLLLYEARFIKKIYSSYAYKYDINKFKREFKIGSDIVNERLNILNNIIYSLSTAIINSCSMEASIGFIHGESRRGGLAFDIADIFKTQLIFDLAFNVKKDYQTNVLMYTLAKKIKENDIVKEMIKINLIISSSETNDEEKILELDKLIDYNNFK